MLIILGTMTTFAHSTPNTSVKFFRLTVAASRILYTVSPNHDMHRLPSCSSKNCLPSWRERRGIYSMMACRTRHALSSASSTMAGRRLSERNSIPMTLKNVLAQLWRTVQKIHLYSQSPICWWCSIEPQEIHPWEVARKEKGDVRWWLLCPIKELNHWFGWRERPAHAGRNPVKDHGRREQFGLGWLLSPKASKVLGMNIWVWQERVGETTSTWNLRWSGWTDFSLVIF